MFDVRCLMFDVYNIYFLGKKISIFSYKNMMNTFSNGINNRGPVYAVYIGISQDTAFTDVNNAV